jgi:hypothetical protein
MSRARNDARETRLNSGSGYLYLIRRQESEWLISDKIEYTMMCIQSTFAVLWSDLLLRKAVVLYFNVPSGDMKLFWMFEVVMSSAVCDCFWKDNGVW